MHVKYKILDIKNVETPVVAQTGDKTLYIHVMVLSSCYLICVYKLYNQLPILFSLSSSEKALF